MEALKAGMSLQGSYDIVVLLCWRLMCTLCLCKLVYENLVCCYFLFIKLTAVMALCGELLFEICNSNHYSQKSLIIKKVYGNY